MNRNNITLPGQPIPAQSGVQAVADADRPAGIIDVRDVALKFNADAGVYDLNFTVQPGTIFGLIGPSGCGKTTTVRLMTGVYTPQQGFLKVLGHKPSEFSAATRQRLGYMPQQFVLYPNLTVWENLSFVASLYGVGYFERRKRMLDLLEFVELSDARNRLGSQLSGGMQRRLSLASSLIHDPALLFADEPTAGIDPVLRSKFWAHFRSLRDQGRTLLMTTQYVGEAAYCDMIGVMRAGRMIHVDTPDGLRRSVLGGEVVKIVVDEQHTRQTAQLLQSMDPVRDVRRSRSQEGLLYVYVEDAGATLPLIFAALSSYPEITVQQAEEYTPPFDDIFVALMEQDKG